MYIRSYWFLLILQTFSYLFAMLIMAQKYKDSYYLCRLDNLGNKKLKFFYYTSLASVLLYTNVLVDTSQWCKIFQN